MHAVHERSPSQDQMSITMNRIQYAVMQAVHERRSSRQGCNPAGESPAVSVARVGYVVMPHPGAGNQPGYAWCKRPGRLVAFMELRWVQPGGLASVGA